MSKYTYYLFLTSLLFFLTHCDVSSVSSSVPTAPREIPLSQEDPLLRTCIFQPQTRIAHFPMYHFPATGKHDDFLREKVSKSQFQLLHTILTYLPHVAVFEENVTTNTFGPGTFQALIQGQGQNFTYTRADGVIFNLQERYNTARNLFHGGIPLYYNHLGKLQKEYLFQTGASMTLYYLGHILQIHKVIEYEEYQVVIDQINQMGGVEQFLRSNSPNSKYYIFDYREEKLRLQVEGFFAQNPGFQGLVLIAYGAQHEFQDDFAGRYFEFEKGSACLQWDRKLGPQIAGFFFSL